MGFCDGCSEMCFYRITTYRLISNFVGIVGNFGDDGEILIIRYVATGALVGDSVS